MRSSPGSTGRGSFPATRTSPSRPARPLTSTQREWGQPLGDDEYVLQRRREARRPGPHAHPPPTSRPGRGGPMRAESEYRRFGTLAYLAAYDVHRARVIGRCEPHRHQAVHRAGRPGHDRPSRTPRRGGSSGSSTTAPRTAPGPPQPGSATPIRTRRWSTCRSTHPGSTRSRSTSPSSSASSSPPTTSRTSTSSPTRSSPSKALQRRRPALRLAFTRNDLNRLLARIRQHDRHAPRPLAA